MFNSINQAINASLTKRTAKDEKGFTLIELLVVVLIIGILAAIAIPVFIGQQNKAKDAAVQSDLATAKTALISIETNNAGALPAAGALLPADLNSNGFTPSSKTTAISFYGTASGFCVQETSSASNTFHITDSSGAASGACGATGATGSDAILTPVLLATPMAGATS